MKVKLTYLKPTGKFYSTGEYTTTLPPHEMVVGPFKHVGPYLFEIWSEVQEMLEGRRCPDLVEGHSDFFVLVDVPEHPHNHPHLIISKRWYDVIRNEEERRIVRAK